MRYRAGSVAPSAGPPGRWPAFQGYAAGSGEKNRTFLPPALPDNLRNPARQGSRNARRQSRSGIFRTIRREEDRRYPDRPRERLQSPFESMGRTQDERHAPDHAGEQDSPRPVYQTGRPLRSATGHQQPPTDPLSQLHRRRKHPRNPRDAGLVGRRPDRHDPRSLDDRHRPEFAKRREHLFRTLRRQHSGVGEQAERQDLFQLEKLELRRQPVRIREPEYPGQLRRRAHHRRQRIQLLRLRS